MINQTKQELRTRFRAERAEEPRASRDIANQAISQNILHSSAWQQARVIFTYLSFKDEIDTRTLIQYAWEQGKRVALPRCVAGGLLTWHEVSSFEGLVRSRFGVEEPDPCVHVEVNPLDQAAVSNALALVPGLAFDKQGYRLGYGGGFYDRFLAQFSGASMGLCRDVRLFDSLTEMDALELYDQPVDFVVTETSLTRANG